MRDRLRLAVVINPAADVERQARMNLPRILREASDVMPRAQPEWIIEPLPVKERQVVIEGLQAVEERNARPGGGYERSLSRSRHGQRDRVDVRQEVELPGEPEVIPKNVFDRAISSAELEGVVT